MPFALHFIIIVVLHVHVPLAVHDAKLLAQHLFILILAHVPVH